MSGFWPSLASSERKAKPDERREPHGAPCTRSLRLCNDDNIRRIARKSRACARMRPLRRAGLVRQEGICRRSNRLCGVHLVRGWAPTALVARERPTLGDRGLSADYTGPCYLTPRLIRFGRGATRPTSCHGPSGRNWIGHDGRLRGAGTTALHTRNGASNTTIKDRAGERRALLQGETSEFQRRLIKYFCPIMPDGCL